MVYLYFLDDLDVCNDSRSVVTFDSWGYVSINYLVSNVYANQFKWRTHLLITPNRSNASRPIQSKNNTMREKPSVKLRIPNSESIHLLQNLTTQHIIRI